MCKKYKYLFYKFYKFFERINGKNDLPEYTAMLAVGFLLFLNLIAIYTIVDLYYPLLGFPDISRFNFFIYGGIPYVLILYFTLIYKEKYKKIVKEFNGENEKQRKKGSRNVFLYILLSLTLTILSLTLLVLRKQGKI